MFAAAGYKRLLSLPLTIETVALKPVRNGRRETTVVEVVGAGEQGFGEDVTHGASDRASFRRLDLGSLSGRRSLAAAVSLLRELELGRNVAHVVVASYRRWAIESALIDLALRQTGLPCVDPLAPDGA